MLTELAKRYGPWIIYRLRDARPALGDASISTGALSLDLAIGAGGIPRGRITELIGPASSGKSTLAFQLLSKAQQQGGFVAYIDARHDAAFDQMARCGVVLSDLFLTIPESAPEALEIATLLIESGGLDALVIAPLDELASSRQLSERLARLNAVMHASPTAVLFLTEARSERATSRAMRHFASLRLQLDPLEPLFHSSGDVLGLRVRTKVLKNKLAPPGREAVLELYRAGGIRRAADLLDLGKAFS
ncbi:MAG: hypothetical protein ACRDFS_08665, partial [Chloroflexota bacterium]